MSDGMIDVEVKVKQAVMRPVAEKIASDFLDWMEAKGFVITGDSEEIPGDWTYVTLAHDFCEEWG